MDKYGVIDVRNMLYSLCYDLESIETCVNCYMEWWEGVYILESYEVNPWNYCGYRTADRK